MQILIPAIITILAALVCVCLALVGNNGTEALLGHVFSLYFYCLMFFLGWYIIITLILCKLPFREFVQHVLRDISQLSVLRGARNIQQ